MNLYTFTGRLARDCETRHTQSGMTVCNFTVAVDVGYGDNKGTNWLRCALFGKRAEGQLPQYLLKGTQVAIAGELRVREYDDKEGVRRTSLDVSVDKLDLIGSKQDSQQNAQQGSYQQGGYQQQGNHQQQGGFPTHGGQPQQQNQQPQYRPQQAPQQQSNPFDDAPLDDIPF